MFNLSKYKIETYFGRMEYVIHFRINLIIDWSCRKHLMLAESSHATYL